MNKIENLTGKKFNRLLVISMVVKTKKGERAKCNCICDCGKLAIVESSKLKNNHTKSCGCYKIEQSIKTITKVSISHGLSGHPLYYIWQGMNDRCHRITYQSYHRYGAKGVKVCTSWRKKFIPFYKWAITNGWKKGLQIDRYPNKNGNYKPSNCRIVTSKVNTNNRNVTVYITVNGITKSSSEWSEITGIKTQLISSRVRSGFTGEIAIYGPRAMNIKPRSSQEYKIFKSTCKYKIK